MLPDRVSNPGPLTYESGALPKQKSCLGTADNEITAGAGGGGGVQLVCGRPTLALNSALVP